MHFDRESIEQLDKRYRVNLVNSSAGVKSANLIGTVSKAGEENAAIFSSVSHLGSSPALIGLILRPTIELERHTWQNIESTGVYTINQVSKDFVENAHYTSAKFARSQSEFVECDLASEYIEDFSAPFVRISRIKLGMQFLETIPISHNNTSLVIGQIEHLLVEDELVTNEGLIDLALAGSVGVSGLNNYFSLDNEVTLPYARPEELPKFSFKG